MQNNVRLGHERWLSYFGGLLRQTAITVLLAYIHDFFCMLCLWLLFLLQSYLYISRLPLICYLNYGQNCVARMPVWTKLLPLKCKIVYSQWSCLGAVIFPQSASACWGLYGYRESMKNYTCSHNLNYSLERKQHWLGQWNHPDNITYSLHIL